MITEEDRQWWIDLIPTLPWHFARTMKKYPHSYVVKHKTISGPDFERALQVIRAYGELQKFREVAKVYFIHDGYRYWGTQVPLEEATIINRAEDKEYYGWGQPNFQVINPEPSVYDTLALEYDRRYDTPECHSENAWVWKLFTQQVPMRYPKILDVGCGTGLALDIKLTRFDKETMSKYYVGVDPSQGMINEFVRKHKWDPELYVATFEQYLDKQEPPKDLDAVISLFGSPSYIDSDYIPSLVGLAPVTIMMHYRRGYWPDYEDKPDTADESRATAADIVSIRPGSRLIEYNNFQVTVIRNG